MGTVSGSTARRQKEGVPGAVGSPPAPDGQPRPKAVLRVKVWVARADGLGREADSQQQFGSVQFPLNQRQAVLLAM